MRMLRRIRQVSAIELLSHDRRPLRGFTTAVSLHSHTLHSKEGLDFVPRVLSKVAVANAAVGLLEERHRRRTGRGVPFDRVYWRPPLHPKAAFELECRQIRKELGLDPLVSITDHDNIEACSELRTLGIGVPYSVEWTVPYASTVFHIGVHNLPPNDALEVCRAMQRVTAEPDNGSLTDMLRQLDSMPDVLIVLNHPLSNEFRTGLGTHARLLRHLLREHRRTIHALELNGLQPARNNVRVAEAISCRYVEFLSQALATYREFPGREHWFDRVFIPGATGDVPLSSVWPHGGPWPIRAFVSTIGVLASRQMRPTLRMALRVQSEVEA